MMIKRRLGKVIPVVVIMLCLVLCVACGDTKESKSNEPVQSQEKEVAQEVKQEQQPAQEPAKDTEPQKQEQQIVSDPKKESSVIKKIQGASDDTGIYAVVITLSEDAADKGEVELVYKGSKGSPQENSVVNTFLIKYYKEDAGTYEVNTFYDGAVYQNYHHQTQVKVNNTFGANLRAGDVTIYYTPDGGERQEIYYGNAEQFKAAK